MITLSSLVSRPSARTTLLATAALLLVGGARIAAKADTPEQSTIALPAVMVAADAPPTDGQVRGHRGFGRGDGRAAVERPVIDKKLTTDQVRDIVTGRLAQEGNANLKVGKVTAKEDGVASVDIVTKTGALVDTQEISTKTGLSVGQERRFERMRARFAGRGHRPEQARGAQGKTRDLALTADQARKLAEARLILRANPHLKIGAVKEKDADTITVDIVASDNSLVREETIDRHTGRPERPFRRRA
jgi:hypothetical protein